MGREDVEKRILFAIEEYKNVHGYHLPVEGSPRAFALEDCLIKRNVYEAAICYADFVLPAEYENFPLSVKGNYEPGTHVWIGFHVYCPTMGMSEEDINRLTFMF